MKSLTIAGNLGRDAEVRRTQGGSPVASFAVAVEERVGQDKRTLWFDCTIWGERGEKLAPHLTKGSKIVASGDLSTREHNGKIYLTLRVDHVTLMGGGQERPEMSSKAKAADAAQRPMGQGSAMDDDLDSIPF